MARFGKRTVHGALHYDAFLSNPETGGGAPQSGTTPMVIAAGTTLATIAHTPLAAGNAGLVLSTPWDGNTGYVDVEANGLSMPWLRFDWDGDGNHGNNPRARARFGFFAAPGHLIYTCEPW